MKNIKIVSMGLFIGFYSIAALNNPESTKPNNEINEELEPLLDNFLVKKWCTKKQLSKNAECHCRAISRMLYCARNKPSAARFNKAYAQSRGNKANDKDYEVISKHRFCSNHVYDWQSNASGQLFEHLKRLAEENNATPQELVREQEHMRNYLERRHSECLVQE